MTTAKAEQPARRASIGARRNPASQAAILAAARAVLAEEGYAGFSIDAVSRRAGAGKPTIYRWWKNKAELLIEVYAAEKARVKATKTGNLAEDLALYTAALWDFWRDTPSGRTFRALIAEAQNDAAALDGLRDKFLPERLLDVRTLFAAAVSRGEIAADEVETRLALYVGFNWYYVLTDSLDEGRAAIPAAMRLVAAQLRS
ncbi:TetR/AcrR family transcriptional regulator [Bosea rubneri]|uniref:TetR/AcrR family transcriptional regulator n=1 Tax=Bosea rubneri TaxID=3075434 RepID=A0ABU3SA49_9HYPH|nr:TetR/AcrR family transcriptional regulator [Bosea sp. ZW T0_25]MDU0341665.1 TetR/AcrR family transcriptional regulator [Bosea sp. ZW T0_25]